MLVTELYRTDKLLFFGTAALAIFAAALPFSVSLIQGGILLFLVLSLVRSYRQGALNNLGTGIKSNPLFIPWLIYLAAGALAAAFGMAPRHSFAALNSDLLTAVTFFTLCLFLKPGTRSTTLNVYLFAVTAAAALGIFQAIAGLANDLNIRAHGTSHPVRFGEIMVIGAALALSRIVAQENLSARAKSLLYTSAVIMIAAIVLSQTRGAYLGLALVLATAVIASRCVKKLIPLFLAGLIVSAVFVGLNPTIRYRILSIFKGAGSAVTNTAAPDQSIGTRMVLWKTGAKIIRDYPILGIGPGNVKKAFPVYCPPPYPEDTVWGSLHNLYIHQTAERGFVGLLALLILFGGMFVTALNNYRRYSSWQTLWALAIMPAWFMMNATEITFQHVHTSYTVLLALAAAITAQPGTNA